MQGRNRSARVLVIDVGGGSVKLMVSGRRGTRAFDSGPSLSARQMVARVRELTADGSYDVVSIGYPGSVFNGQPVRDPPRVGHGWVGFNYEKAFECPVRIINDAALQALAAYRGGRMLFIGLGTGLGSALIADNVLVPLELGLLRFEPRSSLLDSLGERGQKRLGRVRWRKKVIKWGYDLAGALCANDVVIGGGNASKIAPFPTRWRQHANADGFLGGVRLWGDRDKIIAEPTGSIWHIRGMRRSRRTAAVAPR